MRIILLIILFSFLTKRCCGQEKRISIGIIYKLHTSNFLLKKDSIVEVYDKPLIEVEKIAVKFTDVFYNNETKEIRLIGRTFYQDTLNPSGLPGVGIFKGVRNHNILSSFDLISESRNKKNYDNDGLFDVILKLNEMESLYFYMPNFYCEEFRLYELIKDKSINNNRHK
jgi:hypothetical protein